MPGVRPRRVLVVGCGALGRELVTLTRGLPGVDVTCLPAELHNRPERIPAAVAGRIRARGGDYDRVFVAYADCGTGGRLDSVLETEFDGVERIAGAHCYEFYAGSAAFDALQAEEPGTFYLTDFLARQFETIVVRGLGLDRHPELRDPYFGNYRRLVYLAQTEDPELVARARAAADRLGLAFELRRTGMGDLAAVIRRAAAPDSGLSVISGVPDATLANAGRLRSAIPLGPEPMGRNGHRRVATRSARRRIPRAVPDLSVAPESTAPRRPAGTR
jgi:hypothetical protein